MVNKELCKLCGKPKKEHIEFPYNKGHFWCDGKDYDNKNEFTPLPQDVSIEGERKDNLDNPIYVPEFIKQLLKEIGGKGE